MTDLPPDPHEYDDPVDDLSDDTRAELRRRLREDESDVDPAARERNLAAAMAAMVEPPLALDPSLPRPGLAPGTESVSPPAPRAPVTPLDSRRAPRMRVLAVAAAVVAVVGGLTAVNWGRGLSSSGDESADSATVVQDDAGGTADGSGTGSADADASAGAAAPEAAERAEDPAITTTTTASDARVAAGGGLASLGSFDDLGRLFDAAAALDRAGEADSTASSSAPVVGLCPTALSSVRIDATATATFRDAPVLVVRVTDPAGRTGTVVLSSPGCTVLAQG